MAASVTESVEDDVPNWLPLESNPEVLNPFVERLGCPKGWGFADVFGLDPELLMMVPQPCAALCLLFPSKNITKKRRAELKEMVGAAGGGKANTPKGVFFIQQHDDIGNACGTIASIHAVVNAAAQGHFALTSGSVLETFVSKTAAGDASDKGWELAKTKELHEISEETAASGQTEGAGTNDAQDSHFICFVHMGGVLYELDGRVCDDSGVAFPVSHGPTTPDTFIQDAAKVIREEFMSLDPDNVNFNVTALCQLDE